MLSFVSAESPSDLDPLEIPVHCNHLSEVFSKSKANALPPQHLYDYAIEVVYVLYLQGLDLIPYSQLNVRLH